MKENITGKILVKEKTRNCYKKKEVKKIAIFISGRGSNMEKIIQETREGILKGIAEIALVFSDNPKAPGLSIAKKYGLKTFGLSPKGKSRKKFDQEVLKLISPFQVDYIILAGYMRILSPEFVKEYPHRIINIHPADTQQHQGLDGYKWAFENGLSETIITVHYVDEGLDSGEIIAQKKVNLRGVKNLEDVEKRGLAVEHECYPQAIKKILLNKKIG